MGYPGHVDVIRVISRLDVGLYANVDRGFNDSGWNITFDEFCDSTDRFEII